MWNNPNVHEHWKRHINYVIFLQWSYVSEWTTAIKMHTDDLIKSSLKEARH